MADLGKGNNDKGVGFGNTPWWTRWPKGKSGNPKGRPKGSGKKTVIREPQAGMTEFQTLLSKLLREKVTLTLGGKPTSVSKMEAVLMNLFKQAMSGNQAAIREMNRLIEKAQSSQEASERANAEAAEKAAQERARIDAAWFQQLVDLKKKQEKAWSKAAAEGNEEPGLPWPHPDDILIDHAQRIARVRGPLSVKDVRHFEYIEAQRDLMFLRDMLRVKTSKPGTIARLSFWELMWRFNDAQLPLRWQIAPRADSHELANLNMPLRTLRRRAEEAARKVNALEPPEYKIRDRETYRIVNTIMKPALVKLGYRSLAHFEKVAGQQLARKSSWV
ncbi:DUF5681 domain-containing protein [Erythrobacter aurantius]|uniref:DUF5681 domain-containing protein n=1 Tax=Erythrobacter aurantius TaxID=2909249 RepID=UPI00207B07D1|nr:DUF5681 domain-containing protein [Erythrobacter aurantius]